MSERSFDVVVLGGGPAGEVCAGRLASGGLSVAIVEEHLVGGECSYYACMPSKALLRPAQALAEARRVPGAAQAITGELDVAAVLARRDEIVHDLDDAAQLPWLEDQGIELVRGRGTLAGERRVAVGDDVLVAERAVVLATGSACKVPPIDGIDDVAWWGNREATTAKTAPGRLIAIGGGPVGCELAQAWTSLGSDVTLVESAPHVLAKLEAFAASAVQDALREGGVTIRCGVRATAVRQEGDGGEITLTLEGGEEVVGDALLLALGRVPRTTGIGLDALGIDEHAAVSVDERLRHADHPWLYAIGDVNGKALLTHEGKEHGRVAADVILGKGNAALLDTGPPPAVVFTEPQVASVGYTLEAAQEAGLRVRAIDADVSNTAGGSFTGRGLPGPCRIVVDEDQGTIVGATFTGADVDLLLPSATIAIVGEVPLTRIAHAVAPFPSRGEVWLKLVEAAGL